MLPCVTDVNECFELVDACEYGGKCVNLNGSHECICPPGRSGKTCSEGRLKR